jgi:hypothetical protein
MTLKDSELVRANGKLETMASYNLTLEKEVSDARNRATFLNDEIHLGQSETIKQEHTKNVQEI